MGRIATAGLVVANAAVSSAFMTGPALPMARSSAVRASASRQPLRMVATPPLVPPGGKEPGMGDEELWKGTETVEKELVSVS